MRPVAARGAVNHFGRNSVDQQRVERDHAQHEETVDRAEAEDENGAHRAPAPRSGTVSGLFVEKRDALRIWRRLRDHAPDPARRSQACRGVLIPPRCSILSREIDCDRRTVREPLGGVCPRMIGRRLLRAGKRSGERFGGMRRFGRRRQTHERTRRGLRTSQQRQLENSGENDVQLVLPFEFAKSLPGSGLSIACMLVSWSEMSLLA